MDRNIHLKEIIVKNLGLITSSLNFANGINQQNKDRIVIPDDFISNSFKLLFACINTNHQLIQNFYSFDKISYIIKIGLIEINDLNVRNSFKQNILKLANFSFNTSNIEIQKPNIFILDLCINKFLNNELHNSRNKCEQYFSVCF